MKRARLIYNPTSGREQVKRNIPYILDRLERAGYEASCHATTGIGDATTAARDAVKRTFDLVIAAGGDGTLNEVVNGLADQSYRPELGILPMGTTNDFARALHIPRDIEKACDILCAGRTMPIDIGKVNHQYFIYIAGGGKLTEISYEVPSKLKTMLGQMAYYIKGIEMLPSIRPTTVRIEYDGKLLEDEIMLFFVANTNSVAGFEKLAPDASIADGMFDLLILKKANLAEFIRLARLALKGEHIDESKVIYTQASHIRVETEEKMQLNLDGEYGGLLPATFDNLRHHLRLVVPEQTADYYAAENEKLSEDQAQ
ncbi:diacylglycerol kinase [Camelliibacillus cellulosilyticus]|uniref:Diacylglycerol kinase n=1 Tax=Camelliibacillus cellulosilyticus TaxID=2174486 RepID=A0ABV9GNZ0_9BACL